MFLHGYGQGAGSKGQAAAASIHGSLLIVGEMLSHTGDFMVPRFQEVCQAVLSVREHKDRCIRLSVLEILPRLAHFCSDMFARVYLDDCLLHLMAATRHAELRPHAFLALGACRPRPGRACLCACLCACLLPLAPAPACPWT